MMNYEIFKEVVAEKFMDYLPEEYRGMQLQVHSVGKVNQTMDGLTMIGDGVRISPTIYINNMYEDYLKSEDLQAVLVNAAATMDHAMKDAPDILPAVDMSKARDNIVFQLINTEQNKQMLTDMPNRPFQDLSIIYRWVIKVEAAGVQSTVIHNNLAKQLGFSEEELFKLAVDNTRRIFPPTVRNMNDVMREMFAKDGMPADVVDMMIGEIPPEQCMYVISNNRGLNGAISMLYEDQLHKLAEQLETDLYIMPSSVHEVLAVSTDMGDPESLAAMVAEVNMQEVSLDERLSNQVYHYDKDLRKLSLATDTPNKRLDGIVAEPKLIYDAGQTR